ncbi:hypothetical protein G9A89_008638 [Geosiphon pyriformis]|nr:hypothetical protein G9A89_008638 [Geosiphon pyriformis]
MTKKRRPGKGSEQLLNGGETSDESHTKVNGFTRPEEEHNSRPSVKKKKREWKNLIQRTIWTFIMIGGFLTAIAAGHVWVIILVVLIQTMVYKEVIALGVPSKEQKLPWFRTLNWYFLASTNYFLYGESIIYYFKEVVLVDAFLLPLATHHRFISFILYCIGFVVFVANLEKGHYQFQFRQFGWTHMTLLIVICQSHFIINNIFEGMIWFLLPVSLVICNDIFAYICGKLFGRKIFGNRGLTALSPNKTIEGFIGAWIFTIIFGVIWGSFLSKFNYMICPVKDISVNVFTGLTCEINPVFVAQRYVLNPWLQGLFRRIFFSDIREVWIAPIQWHVLVMACFASSIAPFGGYFASGLKRALGKSDWGDYIPGHGGITDRMDCQFLMGMFSYMYYQSFIKTYSYKYISVSVGSILDLVVTDLQTPSQLELYENLQQYLIGQGLLEGGATKCHLRANS